MCENCFNDRRAHAAPGEEDYSRPLDRLSVAEANSRLRMATAPYNLAQTNEAITGMTKQRHRARRTGRGDFDSVGSYLEHMTS
jgi:hypothetical protein